MTRLYHTVILIAILNKAILQNLFFGTLNQKMNERGFAREGTFGDNKQNYGVKTLFRYADQFAISEGEALALFKNIPFLNGGLFDCLDKENNEGKVLYADGFSRNPKKQAIVPDFIFFGAEEDYDLNETYGTRNKRYKVKGLFEILSSYKFTITENTPIEEEIALDPELLGKVFENLLAAYNPETGATARKQTGSFYTPREIVNYMVDESLKAYLKQKLETEAGMKPEDAEIGLEFLIGYNEKDHLFDERQTAVLINAIDACKILDPACGSGAFPMGVLHKMVHILHKLDPQNRLWKERQVIKVRAVDDAQLHEVLIADIEAAFTNNELDYGRKLYLIENCIYGVDIQPIAIQISKLRFFISLIVEQKINAAKENYGIRSLPNLETKFVAANTLIGLETPNLGSEATPITTARKSRRVTKEQQASNIKLENLKIVELKANLKELRHQYFSARTRQVKRDCQENDKALRKQISALLVQDGWGSASARQVAAFDPYDQNASTDFFDSEWMFGLTDGFDIVIGNPPYVRIQTLNDTVPELVQHFKEHYAAARKGNYDLYVVFVESGLNLLHPQGQLAYILPHKFFNAQYGEPLRQLLSGGKHLRHVVHFGDQQIFPGATNYVCLLFLAKGGSEYCRWVCADDLPSWLDLLQAPEAQIAAGRVTAAEWNFVVGEGRGLFEKLQRMPVKLGEVADIFVGLQTSADDVFIMNFVSETTHTIILESKALGKQWTFEKGLLRPIVSGTDVSPFGVLPNRQFILFPYEVADEKAALIPLKRLRETYPKTANYLLQNKTRLEEREHGKFQGDVWYRFGRSQNLGIQQRPKLCVPRLVESLHAAADFDGMHFLDNVDVGGVTPRPEHTGYSPAYLLALMNSSLLGWFFPQVSAPFRGGFRSANKQFLSLLPIHPIDFKDKTDRAEHETLVDLVGRILKAKKADAATDTSALEREIDERVYRLYGLSEDEIAIVEGR